MCVPSPPPPSSRPLCTAVFVPVSVTQRHAERGTDPARWAQPLRACPYPLCQAAEPGGSPSFCPLTAPVLRQRRARAPAGDGNAATVGVRRARLRLCPAYRQGRGCLFGAGAGRWRPRLPRGSAGTRWVLKRLRAREKSRQAFSAGFLPLLQSTVPCTSGCSCGSPVLPSCWLRPSPGVPGVAVGVQRRLSPRIATLPQAFPCKVCLWCKQEQAHVPEEPLQRARVCSKRGLCTWRGSREPFIAATHGG